MDNHFVGQPKWAGDWTEDFSHENGNYVNVCYECGKQFIGHKRRIECKVCAGGRTESNEPNPRRVS